MPTAGSFHLFAHCPALRHVGSLPALLTGNPQRWWLSFPQLTNWLLTIAIAQCDKGRMQCCSHPVSWEVFRQESRLLQIRKTKILTSSNLETKTSNSIKNLLSAHKQINKQAEKITEAKKITTVFPKFAVTNMTHPIWLTTWLSQHKS